jgi:Xaa-Pro aminopeptidase
MRWRFDIAEAAGHGEHYLHGLGHGLGLRFTSPALSKYAEEQTLEPDMVFSIEPGITSAAGAVYALRTQWSSRTTACVC